MKEHFLTYEQSLAVKELGFNEPCFGYWKMRDWLVEEKTRTDGYTHADQECSAPLKSQFFKWVRDKGYKFNILNDVCELNGLYYFDAWLSGQVLCETDYIFETYEQAEDACINKIIELIKNK